MKFFWTRHAEQRQKEWERKLGLTKEEVEVMLENPEQVVKGDEGIRVAQARRMNGLLRVPFVEREGLKRIITVYWTSKVEKYWKE